MDSPTFFLAVMSAVVHCLCDVAQVDQCPPYDVIDKTVYLPHPHDCSWFRRCQAGKPILGRCPPGEHFNPVASACSDPATAGCTAVPKPCAEGDPKHTCRYNCTCSGREYRTTCPVKVMFQPLLQVFGWTNISSCAREPEDVTIGTKNLGHIVVGNSTAEVDFCPEDVRAIDVPHFADCTKAVECVLGHGEIKPCDVGESYDRDLGSCEDSSGVECDVAAAAPPGGCPKAQPLSSCPYSCDCVLMDDVCPVRLKFSARVNYTDSSTHPDCLADPSLISIGDRYLASLDIEPTTAEVNYCPASSNSKKVLVPDELECERVFICVRGKGRLGSCPSGRKINKVTVSCQANLTTCQNDTLPSARPPLDRTVAVDLPCPIPTTCAAGDESRLPHPTDCNLFCECLQGTSILGACPPGLHFNKKQEICDSPDKANCQTYCSRLPDITGGKWDPVQCNGEDSPGGRECHLNCDVNYILMGSAVINCTHKGWYGTGGLNVIPFCNTSHGVAQSLVNKLNDTMAAVTERDMKTRLLFVLDESGSVTEPNFEIEKNFVESLITAFPLFENRSAGVITFSTKNTATVDISLRQTSTCDFVSELKKINYSFGWTDLAGALAIARDEIDYTAMTNGTNSVTLIFIITDGESQTPPEDEAKFLRDSGNKVFTIGVADFVRSQLEPLSSTHTDGSKLFFGLPSFDVFKVVAEYLRTTYQNNTSLNCP